MVSENQYRIYYKEMIKTNGNMLWPRKLVCHMLTRKPKHISLWVYIYIYIILTEIIHDLKAPVVFEIVAV